ncbi:hypothetical protein D3C72_742240 [compost metagenome]|jgi:predicted RNA-binding protein YlqC (UPF0109 family)
MQAVAEVILKALASRPDAVVVETTDDGGRTVIKAHVDQADVARVIGRQGRTINAVRTIVKAAALKHNHQVSLDLVTPDGDA